MFPELLQCASTYWKLRALIQPELASRALPHIRVPHDFPTVQRAIDRVPHGGTVWASEGIYRDRIRLKHTNVHLVGVAGAAKAIVDGCEVTGAWRS